MAPAHAPLTAATADAPLQLPDAALTYATSTACASIGIRSTDDDELRELLLPSRAMHGSRVHVETSDTASGCSVRVEVYDRDASGGDNVSALDIAAAVHANVSLIGRDPSQHMRGESGLRDLVLERVALHVANKHYDIVLRGSAHVAPAASSIVLYGAKCSPQLHDAALVLRHVVPSGVDAGSLAVEASDDIAVASGHALDCAVVLDVTAHAPLLRADSIDDALTYVRAFDAQIDETFDATDRKRVVATIGLYAQPQAPSPFDSALLANDAAAVASPYNAPTKELTLGVLAGLFGLVAMLVAVVMMKKRHEQECEERYRNASKAAQIRRVSIRMASPHRARNAFGEEDDEEKEYEAYDERDGLL